MPAPDDAGRGARLRQELTRGILLAVLAATGAIFVTVDARSHSVSDTFYGMVVPEAVVIGLALATWLLVQRVGTARR